MSRPAIDRSPRVAQTFIMITRETRTDKYNIYHKFLDGYATTESLIKLLALGSGPPYPFPRRGLAERCYKCNGYLRLVPVEEKT